MSRETKKKIKWILMNFSEILFDESWNKKEDQADSNEL